MDKHAKISPSFRKTSSSKANQRFTPVIVMLYIKSCYVAPCCTELHYVIDYLIFTTAHSLLWMNITSMRMIIVLKTFIFAKTLPSFLKTCSAMKMAPNDITGVNKVRALGNHCVSCKLIVLIRILLLSLSTPLPGWWITLWWKQWLACQDLNWDYPVQSHYQIHSLCQITQ